MSGDTELTERQRRRILRICLTGQVAVGAGLAAWAIVAGALSAPLPLPLLMAIAGAGFLYLILAYGVWRRSRTAWAFALSSNGVTAVVAIFALPALVRAGLPGPTAAMLMALLVAIEVGLVTLRDEFRALDLPPGKD